MKIEKIFMRFSAIPLLAGSIILGGALVEMSYIHVLAMILLMLGGVFMGIGIKN